MIKLESVNFANIRNQLSKTSSATFNAMLIYTYTYIYPHKIRKIKHVQI